MVYSYSGRSGFISDRQNRIFRRVCKAQSIGHFHVALCLGFKTSPSTKPFIWEWVWFAWKWTYRRNTFSIWMVFKEDCFDTLANDNSEMVYSPSVGDKVFIYQRQFFIIFGNNCSSRRLSKVLEHSSENNKTDQQQKQRVSPSWTLCSCYISAG